MPLATDIAKTCRTPKQRDRVDRILKSARQAFAASEFQQVLVEEVARSAGVGKGTIYRYFPDKESLYFAVIFDGIQKLNGQIESATSSQAEPEMAIREFVLTLVTFFRRNRFFFRLMDVEDDKVGGRDTPNRKRWERERSSLIGAIAGLLEQANERGGIQVIHPKTEAQILMGMVRSVLRYNPDRLTIMEMSDEISGIFLEGMRNR